MNKYSFSEILKKILKPSHRKIEKKYDILKNVNTKICSECKGLCCKNCGCHFSPDDFEEISFEYLKKELEKGYISIDFVDEEFTIAPFGIYILRIRNQGAPIVDTFRMSNSPCILLSQTGCMLSYNKRPSGGKLLIPSNEFSFYLGEKIRNCMQTYPISDCCEEWKPYQKILKELRDYFNNKDFPCNIKNEF